MTINGLALCAGVGGLELGLRLLSDDYRTICYVERDAYAAAALVARMEDATLDTAPIWDDVSTFECDRWRGLVDVITAGYPCQPFSVAGRKLGESDERHLWPHIKRIIGEIRPELVVLENVARHIKDGFETVRSDLLGMGYRLNAGLFSAAEIGAPHERLRLFAVARRELADDDSDGRERSRLHPGRGRPDEAENLARGPRNELGDTEGGRFGELRESPRVGGRLADGNNEDMGDAEYERLPGDFRRRDSEVIAPERFEDLGDTGGGRPNGDARRGSGPVAPDGHLGALPDAESVDGRSQLEAEREGGGRARSSGIHPGLSDPVGDELRVVSERRQPHEAERGDAVARNDGEDRGDSVYGARLFPPLPGDVDEWTRVLGRVPEIEPAICRVANVMADRVDELRCAGNGVHSVAAAVAIFSLLVGLGDN